ncbi:hypothetical protein [Halorussus sp. GCM10023401]|uniref:hypothetical protein n=1 Tax=Halorussus sp. GCM10023401 TaxID=3252680 RepID=UPI003606B9C9
MGEYARVPELDVADAETLLEPDDSGEGNWVGAPCVHRYDGDAYLAVRERTSEARGSGVRIFEYEAGNGGELREVAAVSADELGVESVERPAMATDPGTGDLRLYLPVDRGTGDWRIVSLAPAADPTEFDSTTARTVLAPREGTTDRATVKDPHVVALGGRLHMFYSGHDGASEQAHLATSTDGETWTRSPANPVFERGGWHDHHTRVSCVLPAPDAPVWQVFYEGSGRADYGRTWNLRTGMAVARDFETIREASARGPTYWADTTDRRVGVDTLTACRYLDALDRGDEWELFFEVARDDGAFELRRARVDVGTKR